METHSPQEAQSAESVDPVGNHRPSGRLAVIAIAIVLALVILLADQAAKSYVVSNYLPNEWIAGTPSISLVFVTNVGGICGYAQGAGTILTAVGIATSALIIAFLFTAIPAGPSYGIAFGMLLAGALGNLIDRLRFGYVVDFITLDLLHWPSFNIADASIIGGIALIGLLTVWEMIAERSHEASADASSQGPNGGPRVRGMALGWSTVIFLAAAGVTFAVAYWFCVYRPFD